MPELSVQAIFDTDSPHEECGVLAISSTQDDAAQLSFFGLFALQHRGQEAAGIAVADGKQARLHKDVGLVGQVLLRTHSHHCMACTQLVIRATRPQVLRGT